MENFNRQYRFSAGQSGAAGFELGEGNPISPHISFSIQKQDMETSNSAKITLWNLSKEHLMALEEEDCMVMLKAGYGGRMPLVFMGMVSHTVTTPDGADTATEIEAVDSLAEIRDTYISVSYAGNINAKKLIDDTAGQMGVVVTYGHDVSFADIPNGYAFIGKGKEVLNKACSVSGASWSLQNGILQVKKSRGVISQEVYVISPETGLISIPKKIKLAGDDTGGEQSGYEVVYLMNAAIGIDDYVKLESRYASGFFRVQSLKIDGDNLEGSWQCTAQLYEVV